jgi:hypothetical protein
MNQKEDQYFRFPCGCRFKQLGDNIKECDNFPPIEVDYYNLPDCQLVWDLLLSGNTVGVFQLEQSLGQTWSKRSEPKDLEELAALVSILRPGVLNSIIDDKSLTKHYTDRKSGKESVEYLHPSLESILSDTYGILIYQEQAINIVKELAGFNLSESDVLRKAIGKKDAKLMAKVKGGFLKGCKKTGIVNEEEAEEIFGWIKEGQKYGFNKCLDPTTLVETPNGYKIIDELAIGDTVLSYKNETENEFVEVLDVIDSGEKELYEITLEGEQTISCSLDHEFMCSDGVKYKLFDIIEQNLDIIVYND